MFFKFLVMPLFGGFTGYITNYFAIKMLFRPHKPYYIGSLHIPLTPGLIIREKERISESIGNAVGKKLLVREVIEKALISDKVTEKLSAYVKALLCENEKTVLQLIEPIGNAGTAICGLADDIIYDKLLNFDYGEDIAKIITGDNFLLGMMSGQIGEMINRGIRENSGKIMDMIRSEARKTAETKISELTEKYGCDIDFTASLVKEAYIDIVKTKLDCILENIDISEVIRERMKEFDVIEFEDVILSIVKKELKIIEYLGAVFGFILGAVLAFFSI